VFLLRPETACSSCGPKRRVPPAARNGVFLLRPELDALWDYRIFVAVDEAVAVRRAMRRDQALFGAAEAVRVRYLQRYMPAQRFYMQAVHPQDRADVSVENNDPTHPRFALRAYPS